MRALSRLVHLAILTAAATFACGLHAAKNGGSAGWSGAVAISPVLNPDPTRDSQLADAAVNESGLAVAAWDRYGYSGGGNSSIGAAVQPPGGKWGSPLTLSDANGFALHPKCAAGNDGTLAVAWTYQTPVVSPPASVKIQVAVRPPGATAWTVSTLAQGPFGGVSVTSFVRVAIDAYGNVTAAWTLWNGAHNLIQSATRPAGGAWTTPVTLTAVSADGILPALSVNARGDAGVVWSETPYAGVNMPNVARYAFRAGPAGSWTAPVAVSETLPNTAGYVTSPLVTLSANGLATIAYLGLGIEAVRETAPGVFTAPQAVISPPNAVTSTTGIDLGTDANGNSVLAASLFDATIGVDRASIWVARGTAGGSWTAPVRLTDPAASDDAYAPRVAVSPDGTLALVGWIDHFHGAVLAARLGSDAWSVASIGRGTAFSSFQEVLGLDAGSGTSAVAIWKSAKGGLQILAARFGR